MFEARIEHALSAAYLVAKDNPAESERLLSAAEGWLDSVTIGAAHRACFFARLIDQHACPFNNPR
jgi:hypothetical protein